MRLRRVTVGIERVAIYGLWARLIVHHLSAALILRYGRASHWAKVEAQGAVHGRRGATVE